MILGTLFGVLIMFIAGKGFNASWLQVYDFVTLLPRDGELETTWMDTFLFILFAKSGDVFKRIR